VRTDLDALMSDVLTLRGVVAVALIDADGGVVASAAEGEAGLTEAGPLLASALAASGAIGEIVGGSMRQTVIEYRGGPVVLTPVPAADAGRGAVLALRLQSLADLGRVRFHLPRVVRHVVLATTATET
jgi:predicted regulator of Ras-like GTPase activity (Roadblock/LC7/MglB family)